MPRRNSLNVGPNTPVTQGPIPIHGGNFQGVTGYAGPEEWPFIDSQCHWATEHTNGKPFDESLGLLNPASSHVHFGWAVPYWGEITGPITVPFQIKAFQFPGTFYFNGGPLITNVIFDPPHANNFQGDPNGEVVINGYLTLDPTIDGGGPNIHSGAPNGWTNFEGTGILLFPNGDSAGTTLLTTIWTKLNPSAPEVPDFRSDAEAIAGISSVADGGQRAWGSQAADVIIDPLPLLAPFNQNWALPNTRGYMYGGLIGNSDEGTFFLVKDPDLHHGHAGEIIPGLPLNGQPGTAVLLPAAIGPGAHKLAMVWHVFTGPNGKPEVGVVGNEAATALLVFNVEVGDGPPPPPDPLTIIVPQNITVNSLDGNPVKVNYPPPTLTGGKPPYSATSGIPASGSNFPVGVTTVTCSGSDSEGNVAIGTFTITVKFTPVDDWKDTAGQLQRKGDMMRLLLPDGKVVILPSAQNQ